MAVYVDSARNPLGRMLMCHMLADSIDELHAMADAIGVARRHFQDQCGRPHYDICQSKRRQAVALGAVEVSRRELVAVIRRLRAANDNEPATPTGNKSAETLADNGEYSRAGKECE